jgi:alkylresorcinol/alkylpyrone synthase
MERRLPSGEAWMPAGNFRFQNFRTLHKPQHREKIRFVNEGGRLKNQLHRDVPELAADSVASTL